MRTIPRGSLTRLLLLVLILGLESDEVARGAEAKPLMPTESPASEECLAARYPGDAGIAKNPAVLLADDFESWGEDGTQPPAGTWSVRSNPGCRVRIVPGQVRSDNLSGPGERILDLAYWKQDKGSSTGGLELLLGNYNSAKDNRGEGYEEIYIRYYIKLGDEYGDTGKIHGSNLGGRDPARSGGWWVGKSGMLDVGFVHYFYSGLEPYPNTNGKLSDRPIREWEFRLYSYHLDKPTAFGDHFKTREKVLVRPGEWHCLERRLKLNSVDTETPDPVAEKTPEPPTKPLLTKEEQIAHLAQLRAARDKLNVNARLDGMEELWVDGQRTISQPIRYRRDPNLRITYFSLENWYPSLPANYTPERPLKICYDNLVIATKYIGPMQAPAPLSKEK